MSKELALIEDEIESVKLKKLFVKNFNQNLQS